MPNPTNSANEQALLACPFCGGAAELADLGDPYDDSFVHCLSCDVQQIANYTPEIAACRWNTRASPPRSTGDVGERAREMLARQHEAMADVMELRRLSSSSEQRAKAERAIAVWREVEAFLKSAAPSLAPALGARELILKLQAVERLARCADQTFIADELAAVLPLLEKALSLGAEGGGKYISPDLAEVAGIVAGMHTKWMQRQEMMRQQGGFDLIERMADLMDGIVDAVPELQRKLIATIALAPSRNEVLEEAIMAVLGAVREYLPPDGIAPTDFANRVIGAVDNPRINPAIREIENGRS